MGDSSPVLAQCAEPGVELDAASKAGTASAAFQLRGGGGDGRRIESSDGLVMPTGLPSGSSTTTLICPSANWEDAVDMGGDDTASD